MKNNKPWIVDLIDLIHGGKHASGTKHALNYLYRIFKQGRSSVQISPACKTNSPFNQSSLLFHSQNDNWNSSWRRINLKVNCGLLARRREGASLNSTWCFWKPTLAVFISAYAWWWATWRSGVLKLMKSAASKDIS